MSDAFPRARRVIDWDPEDRSGWAAGNRRVARRNLIASMTADHVAFSVWAIWSALVLLMPTSVYGLSLADKLLLGAVAAFVGALVRIPYVLGLARFGGRAWTTFAALILVLPTGLTLVLLTNPGLPFWVYLVCAAATGLGGGNYSASMVNVNALYPQRLKGTALAVNAGGGNLGVAVVQVGALLLLAAGSAHPHWICAGYLVVLTAVGVIAPLFMDDVAHPLRLHHFPTILADRRSWAVAVLYGCTFGSFLGFAFAFSRVLYINLVAGGHSGADARLQVAQVAFVGPLLGAVARVIAGRVADRHGGGRVTLVGFAGMVVTAAGLLAVSIRDGRLPGPADTATLVGYLTGFLVLFVFSGLGSGAVFTLVPALFEPVGQRTPRALQQTESRALSGALIGFAGAFGGLGAVAVNLVLRHSYLATGNETRAFAIFLPCYLFAFLLTWRLFVRPKPGSVSPRPAGPAGPAGPPAAPDRPGPARAPGP
ncbi:MFS transporter [Mycolicibacillus trivialis]|uniref:MFS transporter n=1 Tax=Mycolicibacillus trivialis TaxID=1798 RepID=A0A1X2EFL3_9MYCO|nr:MFS transporter [Mycolicibacillus trivialis]ORX00151.1 MFS transporter [Mycolicibacillus trivialis]